MMIALQMAQHITTAVAYALVVALFSLSCGATAAIAAGSWCADETIATPNVVVERGGCPSPMGVAPTFVVAAANVTLRLHGGYVSSVQVSSSEGLRLECRNVTLVTSQVAIWFTTTTLVRNISVVFQGVTATSPLVVVQMFRMNLIDFSMMVTDGSFLSPQQQVVSANGNSIDGLRINITNSTIVLRSSVMSFTLESYTVVRRVFIQAQSLTMLSMGPFSLVPSYQRNAGWLWLQPSSFGQPTLFSDITISVMDSFFNITLPASASVGCAAVVRVGVQPNYGVGFGALSPVARLRAIATNNRVVGNATDKFTMLEFVQLVVTDGSIAVDGCHGTFHVVGTAPVASTFRAAQLVAFFVAPTHRTTVVVLNSTLTALVFPGDDESGGSFSVGNTVSASCQLLFLSNTTSAAVTVAGGSLQCRLQGGVISFMMPFFGIFGVTVDALENSATINTTTMVSRLRVEGTYRLNCNTNVVSLLMGTALMSTGALQQSSRLVVDDCSVLVPEGAVLFTDPLSGVKALEAVALVAFFSMIGNPQAWAGWYELTNSALLIGSRDSASHTRFLAAGIQLPPAPSTQTVYMITNTSLPDPRMSSVIVCGHISSAVCDLQNTTVALRNVTASCVLMSSTEFLSGYLGLPAVRNAIAVRDFTSLSFHHVHARCDGDAGLAAVTLPVLLAANFTTWDLTSTLVISGASSFAWCASLFPPLFTSKFRPEALTAVPLRPQVILACDVTWDTGRRMRAYDVCVDAPILQSRSFVGSFCNDGEVLLHTMSHTVPSECLDLPPITVVQSTAIAGATDQFTTLLQIPLMGWRGTPLMPLPSVAVVDGRFASSAQLTAAAWISNAPGLTTWGAGNNFTRLIQLTLALSTSSGSLGAVPVVVQGSLFGCFGVQFNVKIPVPVSSFRTPETLAATAGAALALSGSVGGGFAASRARILSQLASDCQFDDSAPLGWADNPTRMQIGPAALGGYLRGAVVGNMLLVAGVMASTLTVSWLRLRLFRQDGLLLSVTSQIAEACREVGFPAAVVLMLSVVGPSTVTSSTALLSVAFPSWSGDGDALAESDGGNTTSGSSSGSMTRESVDVAPAVDVLVAALAGIAMMAPFVGLGLWQRRAFAQRFFSCGDSTEGGRATGARRNSSRWGGAMERARQRIRIFMRELTEWKPRRSAGANGVAHFEWLHVAFDAMRWGREWFGYVDAANAFVFAIVGGLRPKSSAACDAVQYVLFALSIFALLLNVVLRPQNSLGDQCVSVLIALLLVASCAVATWGPSGDVGAAQVGALLQAQLILLLLWTALGWIYHAERRYGKLKRFFSHPDRGDNVHHSTSSPASSAPCPQKVVASAATAGTNSSLSVTGADLSRALAFPLPRRGSPLKQKRQHLNLRILIDMICRSDDPVCSEDLKTSLPFFPSEN